MALDDRWQITSKAVEARGEAVSGDETLASGNETAPTL